MCSILGLSGFASRALFFLPHENRNNVDINFLNIAIECLPKEPFNEYTWNQWTENIKNKTGLKGRNIFMPLRIALTGIEKGPELKYLLPLLNKKAILKKFGKI